MSNSEKKYATPPEVVASMKTWKKSVTADAMTAVHKTMAQKSLYLTKMLAEDPILSSPLPSKTSYTTPSTTTDAEAGDGPATKKRRVEASENGPVVAPGQMNERVVTLIDSLKKETLEFVASIHAIRLFIQLNVPRIEDGNNFGVQIQEEVLNELSRAEDAAYSVLDAGTKYFVTRGKVLSKVLKYPSIMDYKLSVVSLDQKQEVELRLAFKDLRNNYALVDDLVMKNIEKLTKPRSSNMSAMF
eukprot:TRINITY_DN3221_c0_g1_i1.p1 TRINITY_DN3221_c0_g1~~TRINITY_DN3221_c0_g1_i1.p1  ORF type:complete len:244 (-),score=77.21 TRINITY_DN3221_c0_g1_i1:34-765(-)